MSRESITTNAARETGQLKVTIEETNLSRPIRERLGACLADLRDEQPETREEAAQTVGKYGFYAHKGGRHVGVILGGNRIAIITHPTALDFN